MDIWLLLCMIFVALATLEYAVMLGIRFGKNKKTNPRGAASGKKDDKCIDIDRVSLKMFMGIYVLTVGSYFYTVTSRGK